MLPRGSWKGPLIWMSAGLLFAKAFGRATMAASIALASMSSFGVVLTCVNARGTPNSSFSNGLREKKKLLAFLIGGAMSVICR
jgi:hypothetical protein